jgi:hypothetical protein
MSQKIDSDLALVTSKIHGLINKMSLEERRNLLTELERHEKGEKSGIRRKHPRKNYLINVDYVVGDRVYNGLAINFSSGGMYIETAKSQLPKFRRGNQLILTFAHPETQDNLKITGEIARIDNKGIGVKFDQSIIDWWSP